MQMAVTNSTKDASSSGRERLAAIAPALFRPLGVDGVYARTARYEDLVARLDALIGSHREPEAEVLHFPPVMSRHQLEKSGYLQSFPNLLGCVCALHGTEPEIRSAADRYLLGGEWTASLSPADLVLTPAACYPLYPMAAERGPLPREGWQFDVSADCFRHEPSLDLDRLQSFRMREYVRIGTPEQVAQFRERWVVRAKGIADDLGLPHQVAPASDPFFGRTGRMKAVSQVQQSLKFELLIPIISAQQPTACMSFNYHREHFGNVWKICTAAGEAAHTGCVAFGMDRLAVALFCQHGLQTESWPASVRSCLAL